jgi:hypothetical protein
MRSNTKLALVSLAIALLLSLVMLYFGNHESGHLPSALLAFGFPGIVAALVVAPVHTHGERLPVAILTVGTSVNATCYFAVFRVASRLLRLDNVQRHNKQAGLK